MSAFWHARRWWIVAVGLLLVANTVFFFTYRVRYEQRVDDAHARLEQAQEQLAIAKARRTDYEQQLAAHKAMVETIATVYDSWWSTPEARLTKLIEEIRRLVGQSGLTVQSLNFAQGGELAESGTTPVDISFSVQGTYAQLRQLINLLELSDQFIIVDAVSFAGDRGAGQIGLQLRLRTVFKTAAKPPRATGVAR